MSANENTNRSSSSGGYSVANINGVIEAINSITGTIGASSIVVNDYLITLVNNEDGYTLNVTRGSQTQSITVDNAISIESVFLVDSSQESGGKNTIRVLLNNGEYTDFDFYNGKKGDKGDPGLTPSQVDNILNAEQQRVIAENQRISAETTREDNEDDRVLRETLRINNEADRVQQENNRVSSENTRINNENARQSAESVREYNEDQREDAEADRAAEWVSLKSEVNNAKAQVLNLAVSVEELADQVDSASKDVIEAYDRVNKHIEDSEDLIEEVENVSEDLRNMTAQAETLPAGSDATASYENGVLTIGVPSSKSVSFHICSQNEYNAETRVPIIVNPDEQTFYLVPSEDPESTDMFVEWAYVDSKWELFGSIKAEMPVQDVQIAETSIVQDGVANIPIIDSNKYGVAKTNVSFGITSLNGYLQVSAASSSGIKAGGHSSQPIVPMRQHESVFYGLAKAAGDTTQSQSSNSVGVYTDSAKAAIQQMLDVPSTNDIPDVPVQDVQVNGTSVLQDGVANVPKASSAVLGVVRIDGDYGVAIFSGLSPAYVDKLYANKATDLQVKAEVSSYRPIVPSNQHLATFYGLAKAAGSDEKNSILPVGQYTESAKSAISEMLNGSVTVSGSTPTITALPGIRYVCGEVTTLDITLPASGCIDVVFESGSTPTVLTVTPPSGVTVKWANGFDPTSLDANTTYEINIADGLGVAGAWT